MDSRAKAFLDVLIIEQNAGRLGCCPDIIRNEGWRCYVGGVKQSGDPAAAIRRCVFGADLRDKLDKDKILGATFFERVDWDAVEDAFATFPTLYRLWASKHVSGFCGVGKMMMHWRFWDHNKCPCCEQETVVETKEHLIECPDPRCADTWESSMDGLELWMDSVGTHPDIASCIMDTLRNRDLAASFVASSNDITMAAASEQDSIGCHNFIQGRISKKWRDLQASYFRTSGSKRSSRRWAEGLVSYLLDIVHRQWTHRCSILHERDSQGMKLKDGEALETSINEQFDLGVDGLLTRDHHYITRGSAAVHSMRAAEKLLWLSAIISAREWFEDSEGTSTAQGRQFMEDWLATYKS